MKIIQVRDIIRHKTLTIPLPDEELDFKQKILLSGKREKIVAEVIGNPRELPGAKVEEEFSFEKILSDKEIEEFDSLQAGEFQRLKSIQDIADSLHLNMHFFASKVGWRKKVYSFLFTSENPVDFRELLKLVTKNFPGRIHLQRVDVRDRADIIGGPGCCGRPECCGVVVSQQKVTLNAVRDQGIMIRHNDKIYDVSGKLKRCLMHEVDLYRKYRKYLPHLKQEVSVGDKKARVVGLDILNQKVKLHFNDTGIVEILPVSDIEYPGKQVLEEKPLEIELPEIDISGAGVPV